MTYFAACFLCVVAIELFIRLPILKQVGALGEVSRKSVKVISSPKISDHWKEKALQRYSLEMALASFRIGLFLVILGLIVSMVAYGIDLVLALRPGSLVYLVSVEGLVIATIFSCLYIYLRQRLI